MAPSVYSQVGQPKANIKSWEKAAGTARFCDDIKLPHMLHGKILRSPLPHAKIVKIDTSKAEKLPGVKAIITGKDIQGKVKPYGIVERDELPLQPDKVRYVGDEVAAVAAESPKIAREALKLIEIEYEPLPFVLDAEEAVKPGAPLVHDHAKNNILQTVPIRGGKDIETGLSEADHVFEYTYTTQKATAAPLEPHSAIADYNPHTQKIRLWLCSQNYTLDRLAIGESLGIPNNKIQVFAPPVGGAFGQKCDGLAHAFCAILLSMKTLQPVKVILDIKEEFMATRNRHPITRKTKVGVKKDGTITAWKEDILINTGAYASFGPTVALFQGHIIQGAYKFPSVYLDAHAVYTNMSNAGAYRGFSEPQVVFARESIIDDIAAKLKVDRIEMRMRNIIKPEDLPFTTSTGQKVRSCIAQECLRKALEMIGWEEKEKNKKPYHGLGVATMTQWCGARFHPQLDCDFETAIVRFNDDGTVNLHTGGMVDLGTGVHTTIAQIVAEELGIEVEDITVIDGDSDTSGQGQGNYADRGVVIGGSAAKLAAVKARERIFQIAAEVMEASPNDLVLANRKVSVKGSPDRSISLKEVCMLGHYTTRGGTPGAIVGEASWDAPTELLDEKGCGDYCPTYLFAATAAEVKVDPDTGQVEILNLVTVHDPGTIINPTIVEGQVEGGISQAIGYILSEELKYDHKTGKLLNPNYRDYVIPTAMDMPDVTPVFLKDLDPELAQYNHGQKGIGETPCNGPSGAIANAISDAIGVRMTSLPITPEKIVKALKEKGKLS